VLGQTSLKRHLRSHFLPWLICFMGARELTERTWLGGGRWSAASSLWTYFHRLLHMLGILSVDREEFSLLSGHAIRIRHERTGRALATSASLTRAALNTDALSLSNRKPTTISRSTSCVWPQRGRHVHGCLHPRPSRALLCWPTVDPRARNSR